MNTIRGFNKKKFKPTEIAGDIFLSPHKKKQ